MRDLFLCVDLPGLYLDDLHLGKYAGGQKTSVDTGGVDAEGVWSVADFGIGRMPVDYGRGAVPEFRPVDGIVAPALDGWNRLGGDPFGFAHGGGRLGAPGLAGVKTSMHTNKLGILGFVERLHLRKVFPVFLSQLLEGVVVVRLED